jgi:hypothetical protein
VSTACAGEARTVGGSETVTWDVTSIVPSSGDITLAIVSTDPDGAHFHSRESGGCAQGPRLALDVVPATDDAGPGTDGGGDASTDMDGGGGADGSARADAGARRPEVSSGCTCRAARGGGAGADLVVVAVIAAGAVRARKRRRG